MSILIIRKVVDFAVDCLKISFKSKICFRLPKTFLQIENFASDNRFRFQSLRDAITGVVGCNLACFEKGSCD